jgi:phosphopantetheinyl transferase (holo-ACP synthase)
MKTVGIGVDIIDNKRFKKLIKDKNLLIEFSVKRKFLLQKKN